MIIPNLSFLNKSSTSPGSRLPTLTMIPVITEDVVEALATAQNIHKIAFRYADTTNPSYKEFGEDIRKLAINLDLLLNVLQRAEYQGGPPNQTRQNPGPGAEDQVLGDFKGTLNDCEILLNNQRFFQRSGGFVKNLCWYSQVEPEVRNIRERMTCLNIKFSIIFNILDPQVLEDRSLYVVDLTADILSCAEQLGHQVHEDGGSRVRLSQGQGNVVIPPELEDKFMRTTRQTNPDQFKMDYGLDAGIRYFNSITRVADHATQSDIIYHVAIIGLMMALWLVKIVRGSREYHATRSLPSNNAFMRQMDDWGMTIERFFDHFEEILQEAMRRILGSHLILPPTIDLLALFERQRPLDQIINPIVHLQRAPQPEGAKQFPLKQRRLVEMEDTSKPNREVELSVEPPSPWKDRTPQFQQPPPLQPTPQLQQPPPLQQSPQFQQADQYSRKKQAPIEMEDTSIPSWDLERVHRDLRERGTLLKSPDQNYTQTLRILRQTESHSSLVLMMTPLSEGREKETTDNYELDKVQIVPSYAMRTWTSSSLEPQTILFRTDHRSPLSRTLVFQQKKDMFEFQHKLTGYNVGYDEARVLATSQESTLLGGSSRQDLCRLQLWYAPTPNPEENLALLSPAPPPVSTAPGSKRTSWSSRSTSSSSGSRTKRLSTPSIFSIRSSSSGRSSVAVDPPSYTAPTSSRVAVHTAPIAPCAVLFAHKAPTLAEKLEGRDVSRSFLVIEIEPEVTVEEEQNEQEEIDPTSFRCVVVRKSSYLPARRSLETSDPALWDLAAVGLYQREAETVVVKKLKHIILQFDTQNDLTQFMTKFNQLKAVANIKLTKFIQATGERK